MMKLFLLLAIELTALAAAPNCLVEFANVPEAETNYEIIESTYRQLIQTLGKKLTEDTLKNMAKEDPLALPARTEGDHLALERALKTFVEMLKEKGWNTSEVRTRLGATLLKKQTEQEQAETHVKRRLIDTESHHDIALPTEHTQYRISPDERWLVFPEGADRDDPKTPWTLHVIDLLARKRTAYRATEFGGPVHFSKDGSLLLIPQGNGGLVTVPFTNGQPDFSRRDAWTAPPVKDWLSGLTPSADPNVVFANGKRTLQVIDLARKTITPIVTSAAPQAEFGVEDGWRVIPGTNRVVIPQRLTDRRDMRQWAVVEYTGNPASPFLDIPTTRSPVPMTPEPDFPISFRADGEFDLVGHEGKIFRNGPNGLVPFFDPALVLPPTWKVKWHGTGWRPGHPDELVVQMHDPNGNIFRRRVWDTQQNKVLFTFDARFPKFSSGGKVLAVDVEGASGMIRILNVKQLPP